MSSNQNQINAQEMVEKGLHALGNGNPDEARKIFETLIQGGVVNASIWLAKAYACRDLGDDAALMEAVDASLALEPRNPRAYLLKAQKFEADGDHRAASSFYLKALNLAPPPEQTPPDLKLELEKAQERYQALVKDFENLLLSTVKDGMAQAGDEARRVQISVDYLMGKKKPYYQQPKTFFFPELAHIEFWNESFDWVPELEAATDDIRAELQNAIKGGDGFTPYLTSDDKRPQSDPHGMKNNNDWAALYLWKGGELVEENAALFPKTIAALEKVPLSKIDGRAPNVIFSRLRPHSDIPPHNGLINTRLICHLPLMIPEGCGFRVGNDVREWEEGTFWAFDDTIEHEAWNKGDEDRYILLFEIWRPELSALERGLVSSIISSINAYEQES